MFLKGQSQEIFDLYFFAQKTLYKHVFREYRKTVFAFSYGAQVVFVDKKGRKSRDTVPLNYKKGLIQNEEENVKVWKFVEIYQVLNEKGDVI